jgi:hypothetical protein
MTKALLDRVEHQDLSGYATKGDYNYLLGLINSNTGRIVSLETRCAIVEKKINSRNASVTSAGMLIGGTYSHNLASAMGIADPINWNFTASVASTGVRMATYGYYGTVTSSSPSVSVTVAGSTGNVFINAPAIGGYHTTQAALSYVLTMQATMK